jgi:hypothetical protein
MLSPEKLVAALKNKSKHYNIFHKKRLLRDLSLTKKFTNSYAKVSAALEVRNLL